MTLRRRLEIVLGGPARPFELTVRDADLLVSACSAFLDQRHEVAKTTLPPETVDEAEIDAEIDAEVANLQERLARFAGYDRNPYRP